MDFFGAVADGGGGRQAGSVSRTKQGGGENVLVLWFEFLQRPAPKQCVTLKRCPATEPGTGGGEFKWYVPQPANILSRQWGSPQLESQL